MAISFIPTIKAIEFSISLPDKIQSEERFTVEIISSDSEEHDVKIFVHDDNKDSSEILHDGEWLSPYYYLSSTYPGEKEYKIISHTEGKTKICVRLRKTGSSNFDEVCEDINVEEVEESKTEDEGPEPEEESENLKERPPIQQLSQLPTIQEESPEIPAKIILGSQKENISEEIQITKKGRFRNILIYSFTALCVLIIILISLKKL